MRTVVTVALVSVLMVAAWLAFHSDAAAVALILIGLAGYYAGHHDGKTEPK